jgi:xeroderma pigmentosum group C-complementing protein
LLCALLRALGLETRLVCSLQPLTFTASAPTASPAKSQGKSIIYVADSSDECPADSVPLQSQPSITDTAMPDMKPAVTQPIRRIGQSHAHQRSPPPDRILATAPSRTKPIPRPRHPVFWVEVLDLAYQKWIPVDPLATGTVGKPSKLEPPLDDPDNVMTYVIAFEEGGIAKDVTRRYAKAYNAKTRKLRVDITIEGEEWFARLMELFRRRTVLVWQQCTERGRADSGAALGSRSGRSGCTGAARAI